MDASDRYEIRECEPQMNLGCSCRDDRKLRPGLWAVYVREGAEPVVAACSEPCAARAAESIYAARVSNPVGRPVGWRSPNPRNRRVELLLTAEEARRLQEAAEAAGRTVSEYAREALEDRIDGDAEEMSRS